MLGVGFAIIFANVVLVLIILTVMAYVWEDNIIGQTAALIK